jgi:hypothetical protein
MRNLAAVTLVALITAATGAAVTPQTATQGDLTAAPGMLERRADHTATLLSDGRVLLVGGMRGNDNFHASAELFNPVTRAFTPAGTMSRARVTHFAVALRSGHVLVGGGWTPAGVARSAELYDPVTGTFSALPDMHAPRAGASATRLANGDVLIAGGSSTNSPRGIPSAEIYRAATRRFELVGTMTEARVLHTATLLRDGRVLIAGGKSTGVVASAEIFDPATKRFTPTGTLRHARYKHTAGALPDGRVLVAGGSAGRDQGDLLSTAELFDPATGHFSPTDALDDPRFKLPSQAAQIAGGRLLVAGGSRTLEIYDAEKATFTRARGQLDNSYHYMTATRLRDGSVLITGGYADPNNSSRATWIFKP